MSRSPTGRPWYRKSIGEFTEELGKSFAEAKARLQHGFERLRLKNVETFKRIPSMRASSLRGKSKSPAGKVKPPKKKKSPSNSPEGRSLASTVASNTASDTNLTYRISRKPFITSIKYDSSASELDFDESYERILFRNERNVSYSFPRISRSRKIENINIVLDKPLPPPPIDEPDYTFCHIEPEVSRNQTQYESCYSNIEPKTPPAHECLYSNVEPRTTTPTNQTNYESCQNSVNLAQKEKSITEAMENLRLTIAQLKDKKQVNPVRKPPRRKLARKEPTLVNNSPSSSYERHSSPDEGGSSDSELAMSTDISYDHTDDDEPPMLPPLPPSGNPGGIIVDNDVYWIPRKIFNLPRTSSRLSMQSRSSCGVGDASPDVSPIKNAEKQEQEKRLRKEWGMTYKVKKNKITRQLFSIEEMAVVDSGYSDRSGVNSRATVQRVTPSPTSSVTPSPTLKLEIAAGTTQIYYGDQPYVLKSFYV